MSASGFMSAIKIDDYSLLAESPARGGNVRNAREEMLVLTRDEGRTPGGESLDLGWFAGAIGTVVALPFSLLFSYLVYLYAMSYSPDARYVN